MECSAVGMMNDHALRVEASLLYLSSLVPSQQPSRLASTGMQSACLPAVAPPEEPSVVGGPASGLLCRTPDSGSNQAGSSPKMRCDCLPFESTSLGYRARPVLGARRRFHRGYGRTAGSPRARSVR